jgi:hypothetical protein
MIHNKTKDTNKIFLEEIPMTNKYIKIYSTSAVMRKNTLKQCITAQGATYL